MAKVGDIARAAAAAPEAATYQCTASGCKQVFSTTVRGTPLPAAHHPGANWKIIQLAGAPSPATATAAPAPKAVAPPGTPPPASSKTTQPAAPRTGAPTAANPAPPDTPRP